MQREDREGFFAQPVPIEYAIAMQYHTVVDEPMDFKTMKSKIIDNGAHLHCALLVCWVTLRWSRFCCTPP